MYVSKANFFIKKPHSLHKHKVRVKIKNKKKEKKERKLEKGEHTC